MMLDEIMIAMIGGILTFILALQYATFSEVKRQGQILFTLAREHAKNHGGEQLHV